MKTINFKMYPLMIIASALLVLSGCDGTTGIVSDSGIGAEAPAPAPAPTPTPTPTPVPDAGTSAVTASPVTIAADGTETSTVTVTVNDASSNPVTNASVSLDQGAGSSIISAVTNVGDGTYTFTVKSSTPETVTYTATADGVTITQTADVTFTQTEAQCLTNAGGYGTIVINGRTWLDRNLGASQAAAAVDDAQAFGNLHQWGRAADGHQDRNSQNTIIDTLATTLDGSDVNSAWYGDFIISSGGDWLDNSGNIDNDDSLRAQSWSTPYDMATNANQVCPCGYIVPTAQDFMDLTLTDPTARDTFKLAAAGNRTSDTGVIQNFPTGYFWTTDVAQSKPTLYYVTPGSNTEATAPFNEGWGFSVRCIKPLP